MACVYEHRCTVTGKSYIGKTVKEPSTRWTEHVRSANHGSRFAFHAETRAKMSVAQRTRFASGEI